SEPELGEGYLPIPEIRYLHGSPDQSEGMVPIDQQKGDLQKTPEIYRVEAFASTDRALTDSGVVFVQFSLTQGARGFITAQIDQTVPIKVADGKVTDEQGRIIALYDQNWRWERRGLHASLGPSNVVVLVIATKPLAADFSSPRFVASAEA